MFDWNFYSEEFKEYCNSKFDDKFKVSITDLETKTETVLFQTSVNALCGACDGQDLATPACQSLPLLASPVSFDKGGVWYTGWKQNQTIDISAYKGKSVSLKFFATDVGDSIYDTAILIDNVRITTAP